MCWIKLMITVIYSIITCSETLCVNWYVLFHWVRARVDEGSSLENPTIYNTLLHMPLLKQTWERNMECVMTKHVISCCVLHRFKNSGKWFDSDVSNRKLVWLTFLECQHGWIQKNYKRCKYETFLMANVRGRKRRKYFVQYLIITDPLNQNCILLLESLNHNFS